MCALVEYAIGIGLCNKSMTLEDYSHVGIIVLFVVAWQQWNIKNIYSYLINWLPWKHTTCVMIKLLLKSTTMYVVSAYKLLKKIHLFHMSDPFQVRM